ncbi:hypothetical protein LTR99_000834 [Exophiala xenobiotica]|uniref:Xylanolytic transcriptional activator regulatory domain-containing protein n=1 Tax=Vermiconidia calcicola TaxID=1690605 RepID=A0AAV9QN33_9PEZI|nr:hypothetical protein LTR99_000834 [Exophiala xenobiotica]KAK5439867.1 hypothetical protein LTR34_000835 [Exophiala xenobiotica]KAK5545397.1 hypothetical protein LTR25_000404 [Vermiconidia calcicola]
MLLQALKDVAASPNLDSKESADVRRVITNCGLETADILPDSATTQSKTSPSESASLKEAVGGEHYVDASVGSPGRQNLLTQPLSIGDDGGMVGFIGKISEVSWLARAQHHLISGVDRRSARQGQPSDGDAATQLTYFMDEEDILSVDEDYVDPLHWPGQPAVHILSEAFFHSVPNALHGISREQFLGELHTFAQYHGSLSWDQRRWLALSNLIWAVGSRWLHRSMLADLPGLDNHLLYYARARALGLDHRVILGDPDIHSVKKLGLLSLYLYINGSVTRAWSLVGLAIRNATCLGLHLQTSHPDIGHTQRHERSRVWYSLFNLEVTLAETLGKPPSMSLAYTTTPIGQLDHGSETGTASFSGVADTRGLWLNYLRLRRNVVQTMRGGRMPWQNFQFIGYGEPRQQLYHRTRLSVISSEVMAQLYMPTSNCDSWAATQKKIHSLNTQLVEWEQNLPESLSIDSGVATNEDPRAKIDLALYYCSIKMILHRPCLCHMHIPAESDASKKFNSNSARDCVEAALALVGILPEDPTAHEAYQLLPWANLLHYLGQVLSVFILELCMKAEHFGDSAPLLITPVRKAMLYLCCLTSASLSSYKAFRIIRQMLSVLSSRGDGFDDAGIPSEPSVPGGWTERHEISLGDALRPLRVPGTQSRSGEVEKVEEY